MALTAGSQTLFRKQSKKTRKHMTRKVYEDHNLVNKQLPIIFHYDTITSFPTVSNWHPNIEILYCMKGCGQVICDSVEYTIQPGDIVIVNSNVLHRSQSSHLLEYYCLIVDNDFLKANELPIDEVEFDPFLHSEAVSSRFDTLVEAIRSQDECQIAAVRASVLNLLIYLIRNHSDRFAGAGESRSSQDRSIKMAINYIHANYAQKLTLEQLASEVGLSKYYFSREFKKATGLTVIQFINTVRCRNAKKLLAARKDSIHDIAISCGFDNDSYFARTFRQIMGCLPSEI